MGKKTKPKKELVAEPFCTPLADYPSVVSAQEFAASVIAEASRRCDAQVELAKSGDRRGALIYLDMLLAQVRTTCWDDPALRTHLELLVRHALSEIASMPIGQANSQPAVAVTAHTNEPGEPTAKTSPITVCKDRRTVRQGGKTLARLTTDEGNWLSACIDRFVQDGTDEYSLREISVDAFGKNTQRVEPSRIFRRSGAQIFHKLFEKTDIPGVYGKRDNVIFEADENA